MLLGAVVGEDGPAQTFPGIPGVEGIEVRPLRVQHPFALKRRDSGDQLGLASREVMKELALAGGGLRPDVIQARATDAAGQHQIRRSGHDPIPGGRTLGVSFVTGTAPSLALFLDPMVHLWVEF